MKSKTVDTRNSYVYIDNNECEIFVYDTQNSTEKKYQTNTMFKFHTCVNCEFATWTRKEMIKLRSYLE